MLIRSLSLKNIRSYAEESVELSEGTTLLAGDIGSGKSTILLALEFALFGIQRGELSGGALLRHGARNGSVTLAVTIAGKEVTITRGLKRTESGVSQEAGTLTVDGATLDLTAQELKAHVLELLNYPPSLLKGRGLLFRSTVYTPQEEMKAILFEHPDERLDALRRLFGIDRYKRIRENAAVLARELRKRETELLARIDELGRDLADEAKLAAEAKRLEALVAEREAATKSARDGLAAERALLQEAEKARFAREELRKHSAVLGARIEHAKARMAELEGEAKRIDAQVAATDLKPSDIDEAALKAEEEVIAEQQAMLKEKERALLRKEAALEATIGRAQAAIKGIAALDECPTCRQPVTDGHKHAIEEEERVKAREAEERHAKLAPLRQALALEQRAAEERRSEILQKQKLVEANKVRLASLAQLRERRSSAEDALVKMKEETQRLQDSHAKTESQLRGASSIDEGEYVKLRSRADALASALSRSEVASAEARKDLEALRRDIARVAQRRAEHAARSAELKEASRRLAWLERHLLGTAGAAERAVFSSVYGLFNSRFREWLSTLMEDETMSARLDSQFTPLITQNGYETDLSNLSGGERTSVALAYRLALNKAVNDFLTQINTRDLLILDEPTDGFSSEQLDRVREVLDRLGLRQIIIVSHEPQMEGYVDHVLRVRKQGHESRISA